MKKEKKASLPVKVIVGVILAILFFIFGLLFYARLQPKGIIDRQACHQSALFRDSANLDPSGTLKEAIPLQCQTQKICFNTGNFLTRAVSSNPLKIKETLERAKGSCMHFSDSKTGVKTISVSQDIGKAKQQMIEAIADEMAGCWKTVGEGYLDYSQKGADKEVYCSICSRIAFDESIKTLGINKVTHKELFEYMQNTQLPTSSYNKKVSYLKFLYNRESLDKLQEDINNALKNKKYDKANNPELFGPNGENANIDDVQIDTSYEYAIITKFTKQGWNSFYSATSTGAIAGAAVGVIFVTALTGGVGTVLLLTAAGGALSGGTVFLSEDFNGVQTSRPTLIPFNELTKYGCTTFEWLQ